MYPVNKLIFHSLRQKMAALRKFAYGYVCIIEKLISMQKYSNGYFFWYSLTQYVEMLAFDNNSGSVTKCYLYNL